MTMEINSSPLALPNLSSHSQRKTHSQVNQRLEISPGNKRQVSTRISRSAAPVSQGSTELLRPEQQLRLQTNVSRRSGHSNQQAISTYRDIENSRQRAGNFELLNRIDTRA